MFDGNKFLEENMDSMCKLAGIRESYEDCDNKFQKKLSHLNMPSDALCHMDEYIDPKTGLVVKSRYKTPKEIDEYNKNIKDKWKDIFFNASSCEWASMLNSRSKYIEDANGVCVTKTNYEELLKESGCNKENWVTQAIMPAVEFGEAVPYGSSDALLSRNGRDIPISRYSASNNWVTQKDIDECCGVWVRSNEKHENYSIGSYIIKIDEEYLKRYENRSLFDLLWNGWERIEPMPKSKIKQERVVPDYIKKAVEKYPPGGSY